MEPNNPRRGGSQRYPQRKTIRLAGYDYARAGYYFVTIVTANRAPLFGDERYRSIVDNAWRWLAENYPYVELDEYVVMPNHLHGIVIIRTNALGDPAPKSLSRLIGAFQDGVDEATQRTPRHAQ
jgi:putative transposase